VISDSRGSRGDLAAAPVSPRAGQACASCGRSDRYAAFVDETGRGSTYGLAAAIVCACQLAAVRQVIRRQVRPGQRRVHFNNEQRDRRDIRKALAAKGLVDQLTYQHERSTAEPLLWVADAIAWSALAGRHWRIQITPLFDR
jgi:hypothetical protein